MTGPIDVLLCGLDGSPRAAAVLEMARAVAERFGAELYVARVIGVPPDFPPAAHTLMPDPLPAFLEERARAELVALMAGTSLPADHVLVASHPQPWRGLLELADRVHADLVVVGSHGYAGLDRVLGTTAGKVADRARQHVLVVHERT